jgi:hypothetical protein
MAGMEPTYPQPPVPGGLQPQTPTLQSPPLAPKPKRDNAKLMLIALSTGVGVLVVLIIAALVWPKGGKTPVAQQPKSTPVGQYYHIDAVKSNGHTKGSYDYSINLTNPASNETQLRDLSTDWPLVDTARHPLQFSKDGWAYLFAIQDVNADGYTATPNSFQLVVGRWPQSHEKVILKDMPYPSGMDWLLTADGKEVIYVDNVLNSDKAITGQALYSFSISTGKSTRIGSVSRPGDHENSALFETAKDDTVSYFTSMDDGMYRTTYDRKKHTVSSSKVVISSSFDKGYMGQPSPDGSQLSYFSSSPASPDATVYVMNVTTGAVTPMLKTPLKYGGYSGGYWSPDGKYIVISSSIKDVDGQHYKNTIITVDTTTKATKTETLMDNNVVAADNPKNTFSLTSWSPDARYIAYIQNNQLHYYDYQGKKHVQTVVPTVGTLQFASGWVVKGQ